MKSEAMATPILFHYTPLDSFISILTTNEFKLSTTLAKDGENGMDSRLYYLSLTRSRLGSYHIDKTSYGSVLITLDGSKLGQKYRVKPVDYWGELFRTGGRSEMEDRLVYNKDSVKNAISYFLKIDILIDKQQFSDRGKDAFRRKLRMCLLVSKKYGIPLNFYYNKKDWLTGNAKHSVPIDIQDLFTAKPVADDTFKYVDRSNKKKYLDKKDTRSFVNDLLEVYRVTNLKISNRGKWKKLSENGQNMATAISNEHRNKPMYRDITYEIREGSHPNSAKRLTSLLSGLRLSFESFYNDLSAQWKALIG